MRLLSRLAVLAGVLSLLPVAPAGAAGKWQSTKTAGTVTALPRGKTLARHDAPGRRYVLLLRDEGEKGDFFWRSLYVQNGKKYTKLHTCNELRRVRWAPNGSIVRFEMDRAVGPTEMERREVEYNPATMKLRSRVVRRMKVEASG